MHTFCQMWNRGSNNVWLIWEEYVWKGVGWYWAACCFCFCWFWPFKCFLCFVHLHPPPPGRALLQIHFTQWTVASIWRKALKRSRWQAGEPGSVRPPRPFSKSSPNLTNTPAIDAHYNGITPIVGNSIVEENNVGRASPTLDGTIQQLPVTHRSQVFKFGQIDDVLNHSKPRFGDILFIWINQVVASLQ